MRRLVVALDGSQRAPTVLAAAGRLAALAHRDPPAPPRRRAAFAARSALAAVARHLLFLQAC